MTLPKWQTSMDMRMPPVASRMMYRHSATMHSHNTPAEKTRKVRKKHACLTEAEDRLKRMREGQVSWMGLRREAGAGEQEYMGEQGRMGGEEKEGKESEMPVENRTCR